MACMAIMHHSYRLSSNTLYVKSRSQLQNGHDPKQENKLSDGKSTSLPTNLLPLYQDAIIEHNSQSNENMHVMGIVCLVAHLEAKLLLDFTDHLLKGQQIASNICNIPTK